MLKKSDIIDIISPAKASSLTQINKIENFIINLGLKPNIFNKKELTLNRKTNNEFADFTAKQRFEQIKQALNNKNSRLIWCSNGGYGSSDILPFLAKLPKPKIKKTIIGFSDISALNSIFIDKWQFQVIIAPMLGQIIENKVSKNATKLICDIILGQKSQPQYKLQSLIKASKTIKSIIVGGCLSVIASQFGTNYQIDWHNKILFLEDEGEDGERLDRYFTQLIHIMLSQNKIPKAIILGNFSQANPHGTPKARNIKIAIERFCNNLKTYKINCPLFIETTKSLGHSYNMKPLTLGVTSEITRDNKLNIKKVPGT